jgi:hypothetical protein
MTTENSTSSIIGDKFYSDVQEKDAVVSDGKLYINHGIQTLVWKCGSTEIAEELKRRIIQGHRVCVHDEAIDNLTTLKPISRSIGKIDCEWMPTWIGDELLINAGLKWICTNKKIPTDDVLRPPDNHPGGWEEVARLATAKLDAPTTNDDETGANSDANHATATDASANTDASSTKASPPPADESAALATFLKPAESAVANDANVASAQADVANSTPSDKDVGSSTTAASRVVGRSIVRRVPMRAAPRDVSATPAAQAPRSVVAAPAKTTVPNAEAASANANAQPADAAAAPTDSSAGTSDVDAPVQKKVRGRSIVSARKDEPLSTEITGRNSKVPTLIQETNAELLAISASIAEDADHDDDRRAHTTTATTRDSQFNGRTVTPTSEAASNASPIEKPVVVNSGLSDEAVRLLGLPSGKPLDVNPTAATIVATDVIPLTPQADDDEPPVFRRRADVIPYDRQADDDQPPVFRRRTESRQHSSDDTDWQDREPIKLTNRAETTDEAGYDVRWLILALAIAAAVITIAW